NLAWAAVPRSIITGCCEVANSCVPRACALYSKARVRCSACASPFPRDQARSSLRAPTVRCRDGRHSQELDAMSRLHANVRQSLESTRSPQRPLERFRKPLAALIVAAALPSCSDDDSEPQTRTLSLKPERGIAAPVLPVSCEAPVNSGDPADG